MSGGDRFLFEVAQTSILTSLTDQRAIAYRQSIVADCLKNAAIVRAMYQIAFDAVEAERKNYWSFVTRYPSGILHRSVDVLRTFVGMLKNCDGSPGTVRGNLRRKVTLDCWRC